MPALQSMLRKIIIGRFALHAEIGATTSFITATEASKPRKQDDVAQDFDFCKPTH